MEERDLIWLKRMNCPKCNTIINDNQTVCPKCHKVLLLECPNCHSLEESAICKKCGYHILIKCSKCGRLNPAINDLCVKCGFPTKTSLAYQECECDEIASVVIKFCNLKKIRRLLKSEDLYRKFYYKLKNLVLAQVRNAEGLFISHGDVFELNFNKELSFPTSSNKAVRFAIKLANSMTNLNANIVEELKIPLGLNITIAKKTSEELQELHVYENNLKLLTVKKGVKPYIKGTQIILDHFVWDEINKEYKTDSLFSLEENGKTITFYEIVLDSYILPPDTTDKNYEQISYKQHKMEQLKTDEETPDINSFKVFDINAKCSFQNSDALSIKEKLNSLDFNKNGKIISLRAIPEYSAAIEDIVQVCQNKGYQILTVTCTDEMSYKPWGFFERLLREYYNLPFAGIGNIEKIPEQHVSIFKPLFDLCEGQYALSSTKEDARYLYIELWSKFLALLNKVVILVDGFEKLDDTSIQTLEFYFDQFLNIKPNFIFITTEEISVHSKIKGLLRTDLYTEFKLLKSSFANCIASIKTDASDFIGSFYFEKIQENFNGSYLYFKNAIEHLFETGVLIEFEGKLIVKSAKSIVIAKTLEGIYKSRIKYFNKNPDITFIIAYSAMLYPGLDVETLLQLGINDIKKSTEILIQSKLARLEGNNIIINNYSTFCNVILSSLKREAEKMLAGNIISKIGTILDSATTAILMGKLESYNEEYSLLCNNSDLALNTGDYDAYLKSCLGFLSIVESVESVIPAEDIDLKKKEVYNNILTYLYSYAPTKIYFIENILLTDAINENDNEKIVKLSNIMLQGALISSNYTDALGLLNNILSRMSNPTLIVDGAINTKFLLLSLVNIEILYNIGKYRECVDTATEVLSVIKIEMIDKIKPTSFSTDSFVSHIFETMRLAAFAKLYLMDNNLESFFELIKVTMDMDLPEKDCILAIRDFLAGKVYYTGVIEEYSPFSKIVFLILQEISNLQTKCDYKKFAQNIYQAKLLAEDINQSEIKYFCDLLIAYAYSKIGITVKANSIYQDVNSKAEISAMFNILIISKYFMAKLETEPEKIHTIITDALDTIKKHDNQAVILYALFEKLYIDTVRKYELPVNNIESDELKLEQYNEILKIITG